MAKRSEWVREKTEKLVRFVKEQTAASGPEAKRAAGLAVTSFEQGGFFAWKAFGSSDFIVSHGAAGPDDVGDRSTDVVGGRVERDDGEGPGGRAAEVGDELPTEGHDGESDP